jgi:hypothetical protein
MGAHGIRPVSNSSITICQYFGGATSSHLVPAPRNTGQTGVLILQQLE